MEGQEGKPSKADLLKSINKLKEMKSEGKQENPEDPKEVDPNQFLDTEGEDQQDIEIPDELK